MGESTLAIEIDEFDTQDFDLIVLRIHIGGLNSNLRHDVTEIEGYTSGSVVCL